MWLYSIFINWNTWHAPRYVVYFRRSPFSGNCRFQVNICHILGNFHFFSFNRSTFFSIVVRLNVYCAYWKMLALCNILQYKSTIFWILFSTLKAVCTSSESKASCIKNLLHIILYYIFDWMDGAHVARQYSLVRSIHTVHDKWFVLHILYTRRVTQVINTVLFVEPNAYIQHAQKSRGERRARAHFVSNPKPNRFVRQTFSR